MIYDIAGLRIAMYNKYEYTDKFCRAYLSKDQSSPADIHARVTVEDIAEEKKNSPRFSDGYLENICLYRNICQQITLLDRFLLHASVISHKGNGYAFLGQSGAGKSTHSRLWLKYVDGAKIINGDKPIVHYTKEGFVVYGTPWMGKEGLGEKASVLLKGMCFIRQATENKVERLSIKDTVRLIFPQILHPDAEANITKMLGLVDKLVTSVPAYALDCTISEEAVEKSFEALSGEKYAKK